MVAPPHDRAERYAPHDTVLPTSAWGRGCGPRFDHGGRARADRNRLRHVRSGGGSAAGTVSSMIIWAGVFVMVGVAEEFASRGCALRSLTEGIGFFSGGAANLALVRLPASP